MAEEKGELTESAVKRWVECGYEILKFKDELNPLDDDGNSDRFLTLFYKITKPSFTIENANKNYLPRLRKRLSYFGSSAKGIFLRDFISVTMTICKSENNLSRFKEILKNNNLTPIDEDEIRRQQEQERRRRQEEEERLRRQREEQERLRRQQQERERQEREEAERRRYLEYLEEQRLKKRKRSKIILNSILIAALLFATMKLIVLFRDINYCNKIIIKSEQLADNYQYEDAIKVLSEAKEKISFSNKKKIVVNKIADIESERDSTSSTLRDEINQIWDTYFLKNKGKIINSLNKNVIKYVSKNDIKPIIDSTSEKVELLKNISNDQQEYKDNMVKINVLKNHYKIQ